MRPIPTYQQYKEASAATNVLHLDDILTSARLATNAEKATTQRDLLAHQGLGTLVELPLHLARHIPGIKKLPWDKYDSAVSNYGSHLVAADRAAGNYLTGGKSKFLKSIFTTTDLLPKGKVTSASGNVVDAYVPTEVARLSAPIDKTKHVAVPLLAGIGAMSIADSARKAKQVPTQQSTNLYPQQTIAAARAELIEKMASAMTELHKTALISSKLEEASGMLKNASYTIETLKQEKECLAKEKDEALLKLAAFEKGLKADNLTSKMLTYGLIKAADYDSQVDTIMQMSDDNYAVLKETVEKVALNYKDAGQNSLDKISCILVGDNTPQKESFEDAIRHASQKR